MIQTKLRLGFTLARSEQALVDKGLWVWTKQPGDGPTMTMAVNRDDLTPAENAAERGRLLEQYARQLEQEQADEHNEASS